MFAPIRNFEERKNLTRDLHQQPRHDCVRDRDLVHVASLQFREEIARVHGRSGRSFLWREGGDDFLEARVAAQGIPLRIKTELAVGWPARNFANYVQLF